MKMAVYDESFSSSVTRLWNDLLESVKKSTALIEMLKNTFNLHFIFLYTLRKHAHTIHRDFSVVKNLIFHQKCFDIVLTFAQNID